MSREVFGISSLAHGRVVALKQLLSECLSNYGTSEFKSAEYLGLELRGYRWSSRHAVPVRRAESDRSLVRSKVSAASAEGLGEFGELNLTRSRRRSLKLGD